MVMSIQHKVPGSSEVGCGSVDQNQGVRASLMTTLLFAVDTMDLENLLTRLVVQTSWLRTNFHWRKGHKVSKPW